MNPLWLFPMLSVLFAGLAVLAGLRQSAWRGAARIWTCLALSFGAVSLWLHLW